ncbi:MAG: hypothetical protein RSA68_12805 [Hafnia sp.]|uniref:hypothetical protein n=1 Tax=Hafnia TaxID=568 RepID=UPI001F3DA5F5|nr:hypothetical protein [Hafnia alvei]MCE9872002.1 hypothetical protein [Hafnia alvei]
MNTKYVIVFLSSLLIYGCDGSRTEVDLSSKKLDKIIEISSLPIIQSTLNDISPSFGGKRNDTIMSHVCALSQGTENQTDFDGFFTSKGIELSKLAKEDEGFALLSDRDMRKKHTACIAYMVSSLVEPLQKDYYFKKSDNTPLKNNELSLELTTVLRDKLKVATATAEFFALISTRLEHSDTKSIKERKKEIAELISQSYSDYYQLIHNAHAHDNNSRYYIDSWTDSGIVFSSSDGYLFELNNDILTVKLFGVDWYGNGKLLGKSYFMKSS